ncbi:hypothetical protein LOZ80_15225 [Paenibacillus sp. HWE-109]|uniref:hypothetical protein n=1 Tax=Paenibacillus sp. HWE-109 TaxID=1306526 RepID=UPI001EDDB456|nr:hypothetical protein [Paenibacillus sp. HWE-109]UKS30211.1 hypothetical protein LOZ80_15225 [Paenibacillus sp. HWE-109]
MADSLLNVFFGTLDSLATLVLIYKIFRWPFWRSFNKLIVIAVVISLVSFINRTVLGLAEFDTAIQFVLYIVALRFIIRVSTDYAFSLTAIGYVTFLLIQFIVYPTLLASGIVTMDDAEAINGLGTYIIQIATELVCYAVAFVLYRFGLGFTYVDIPPHDEYGTQRRSKLDLFANILGSVAVATFMYWILNYQTHILIIIPLLAVSLALLLYISSRKEYGRH